MPRIANPLPRKIAPNQWMLDISAKVSETGIRQRLFFATKKAADLEALRLKSLREQWGVEATGISASLAQDAKRAMDILDGREASLVQVAREWLASQKRREASCTIEELWTRYAEAKVPQASEAYAKDISRYGEHLRAQLGKRIVADLTGPEIEAAIRTRYKTTTQFLNCFRTLRPAFSFAVRRGWCQRNPCDTIEKPRKVKSPPCVLTVEQALRLLKGASTDFREAKWEGRMLKSYRLDCRGCVPAVAIALFAGLRPKELERLTWNLVDFDHGFIHVTNEIAKTRSTRTIPMSDNLRAWLEASTSPAGREGNVVPTAWTNKIKALRYFAELTDMQDVLRHSFASYHLALNNDIPGLQAAMGHNTPAMLLDHYRAVVKHSDAKRYWQLYPELESAEVAQ